MSASYGYYIKRRSSHYVFFPSNVRKPTEENAFTYANAFLNLVSTVYKKRRNLTCRARSFLFPFFFLSSLDGCRLLFSTCQWLHATMQGERMLFPISRGGRNGNRKMMWTSGNSPSLKNCKRSLVIIDESVMIDILKFLEFVVNIWNVLMDYTPGWVTFLVLSDATEV